MFLLLQAFLRIFAAPKALFIKDLKETKKVYIETYGCQMNFSDSEIVASLMQDDGFEICDESKEADVLFVNTCSIRDNAEQRVRKRLRELKSLHALQVCNWLLSLV